MSNERGTMSNGHDRIAGLVETMLKLHAKSRTLTADSRRLAADG